MLDTLITFSIFGLTTLYMLYNAESRNDGMISVALGFLALAVVTLL